MAFLAIEFIIEFPFFIIYLLSYCLINPFILRLTPKGTLGWNV